MKKLMTCILLLLLSTAAFKSSGNPELLSAPQAQTDSLKTDARDPVCGMKVKKGTTLTHNHNKVVYGFCSAGCKKTFVSNPDKYLKK
ncbi:YHS domain-containing protein [Pedobacter sp. KBW06]|uniref:YHS domain-containing protein n=1 Tax=Pedobacter sp. KBW06 TaxID=2153359 RepID=UPI0018F6EE43|nr:YHS domain-containing protein [Pedobacter sp. KBW06]